MFTRIKKHLYNYKREIVDEALLEVNILALRNAMLTSQLRGISGPPAQGGDEIVVSLTTYGARIYDVCLTIESLLRQSVKPNRLVLWLDEAEFSEQTVPQALRMQQQRGLELRFCPNLRSYKKLVPALRAFPDAAIITVDDDCLYPFDLVERLVNAYRADPRSVHFTRGNLMKLDATGTPLPYEKWGKTDDRVLQDHSAAALAMRDGDTPFAFPTGVGGVIYPPHALHPDVLNEQLFMQLCPTADDIWFKMMSLLNGTRSKLVYLEQPFRAKFLSLPTHQATSLRVTNVDGGANDRQLQAVWAHYRRQLDQLGFTR